jgi:hypothetical protein
MKTIHASPSFELRADIRPTPYGHHLRFTTFVPSARRPEEQVKFSATLSRDELVLLRDVIDHALNLTDT